MKNRSGIDMAASVRQRLLNLKEAKGADYNALLTQYAIERFLYRLSVSELADRFILKGAMLFRVWAEDLRRPTQDLDLLGFGEPTPDAVAEAVRAILWTEAPDDGLMFDSDSVAAAEIREGQEYGGIRVKFLAMLGKARIPVQIDVGFGDAVVPEPVRHEFPTLLDQEAPELRMYPPEAVVAEKLHAIVALGMANSRMKDFYDLLILFRTHDFDEDALAKAIAATFRRRQSPIPGTLPIGLSAEYGQDARAQERWSAFLRRLQITDAPDNLAVVVAAVKSNTWPAIKKARDMC